MDEAQTIKRALAGDHAAGIEALRMCRDGLDSGTLSATLAHYLAERLTDVLVSIQPDRIITSDDYRQALLNSLRINKGTGKPKDPFPEWQKQLGALAALMVLRGYRPKQINNAVSDARYWIDSKNLDAREARRIRKNFAPMQTLGVDDLMRLAGKYGEILKEYPPRK